MADNTILVLGAGPNVGQSILQLFQSKGYKTAAVARNPSTELTTLCDIVLKGDFTDPSCIEGIFAQVKEKIGAPNVVVYNAYAFPTNPVTHEIMPPFSVPLKEFTETLNINLSTPYMALQHAIQGFESLPKQALKTFIYTGNAAPHLSSPAYMQLTLGKRGGAHMIECAGIMYKDVGYRCWTRMKPATSNFEVPVIISEELKRCRFYFGDERMADAGPMYKDLSGEAHAEHYFKLATQSETETWEQTFVKGKGYVDFEGRVGETPVRTEAVDVVYE